MFHALLLGKKYIHSPRVILTISLLGGGCEYDVSAHVEVARPVAAVVTGLRRFSMPLPEFV